ncbi:unnamed protein product [Phytophthora fragariaefolia]|uniref:Unnamed protein product n=1 Tax=Phytophthora fragariaefolia TaxID=1490495 RepID=A0A9W6Y319_9STRA|nr:unnamed protein product [Phytophthora fragariaefolia]
MISPEVMQELLSVRQVLHYLPESTSTEKGWTEHEQHLFWVALAQHPQGPWTTIAEFIGTKSARQTMTHGQKLRQKLKRWNERLRSNPTASMLMDGIDISTSANIEVTTLTTPVTSPIVGAECGDLQQPSFPVMSTAGDLQAELTVEGMNIVEMDGNQLSGSGMMAASSLQFPAAMAAQYVSHPNLSEDTARIVELMLSESSEEVQLTDISDEPEILPQHLLDDLLDILSDDDLNELGHHHQSSV